MSDISHEIIRKASCGDLKSFEMIYQSTCGFVFNVAFRMLGDRQEAEDMTQQVFMTIHEKLKDFRFESSFRTWAYRITVNSALNRLKKRSKERTVPLDNQEALSACPPQEQTDLIQNEQKEFINSLLALLNPDQRACLVLRSIQGLSYRQISETLNININTVRSRIKRARETLLSFKNRMPENEL